MFHSVTVAIVKEFLNKLSVNRQSGITKLDFLFGARKAAIHEEEFRKYLRRLFLTIGRANNVFYTNVRI